jgi:hypothetical protein
VTGTKLQSATWRAFVLKPRRFFPWIKRALGFFRGHSLRADCGSVDRI